MPITASNAETTVSRILSEDVLTISDARRELSQITGKRPDKSSMARWIHRGVGGTRLEAVRIGSQLITSRQAVNRFIVARTEKTVGNQPLNRGAGR